MDQFRLLILSSGRAGSTSLLNALYYSLNDSTRYFEALDDKVGISNNTLKFNSHLFEIRNPRTPFYLEKNLVSSPSFHPYEIRLELYNSYITYFDQVILLARKDIKKTIESFVFATTQEIWHDKYNFKDYKNIDKKSWDDEYSKVIESNQLIESLSNKNNIPITYYEDLFFNGKGFQKKFLENNNIRNLDYPDIFYRTMNPNQKYRQDE